MQAVLDLEVKRWSEMSSERLIAELADVHNYGIESGGTRYQFEVQMMENKSDYVHVDVAVDDGRLPYSIFPLGHSFIHSEEALKAVSRVPRRGPSGRPNS